MLSKIKKEARNVRAVFESAPLPVPSTFPWYATSDEDRDLMLVECAAELDAWRRARDHRMKLRATWGAGEALMAYWPTIAQAFDELEIAFGRAKAVASPATVSVATDSVEVNDHANASTLAA